MSSSRRSRLLWAAFAVISAAALVAVYLFTGTSGTAGSPRGTKAPEPSPGTTAPGSPAGPAEAGGTPVEVYLDGWSYATLSGNQVTSSSNAPSSDPRLGATSVSNVLFVPLNEAEIKALGTSDPDVLTRVASRMVSSDQSMACDADGCTSGAGTVSFAQLADPAQIPGLGASYKGYGIKSSVYKATLDVPADAPSADLGAAGWNAVTLRKDVPKTSEVDKAGVEEGDEVETITVEPDAENGYLKNTYVVSAGLGRFFIPSPSWTGSDPVDQERRQGLDNGLDVSLLPAEATAGPLFAKGLGTAVTSTRGLSASQMTFMTSPTTGCGIGVLCVPGTLDTAVEGFVADAFKVCTPDGGQGVMVVENSVWSFTLSAPTSIYGAWDGKSSEDFAGKGTSVVYTGNAPLVNGAQRLKQSSIRLYDGQTAPTLVASGGQMAQEGKDSQELFERTLTRDDLSGAFEGLYSPC